MLKLRNDWRMILKRAWSVRLMAVSAVFSGLEILVQVFMENPPIPRYWFAAVAFLVAVIAPFARLVSQKGFG
jgi:hypothetical protein